MKTSMTGKYSFFHILPYPSDIVIYSFIYIRGLSKHHCLEVFNLLRVRYLFRSVMVVDIISCQFNYPDLSKQACAVHSQK